MLSGKQLQWEGSTNKSIEYNNSSGFDYKVCSSETHDFFVGGISIGVLDVTGFDLVVAGDKFQEEGVNISPIGVHDIPVNASGMWAPTLLPATNYILILLAIN